MHSAKPQVTLLFDHLEATGVRDLVISPGSRNAPLIIEAQARSGFKKTVIPDERSAGFVALGMAEASGRPVAVISTSGTAVLNYHPAVAEAFYRRIPLIVLSADRPEYRIDKGEGQSIRQRGALHNHVIAETHLSESQTPEVWNEKLTGVLTKLIRHSGPIHINLPFEEPLYESVKHYRKQTATDYAKPEVLPLADTDLARMEKSWQKAGRKMIIAAQGRFDPIVGLQLERLAARPDTVVLTETTANLSGQALHGHIDRLIFPLDDAEWEKLAPDLVITLGNNIISKKIKFLLRQSPPAQGHWHIGAHYITPDTFDRLTEHVPTTPAMFFSQWLFRTQYENIQSDYAARWAHLARARDEKHKRFARKVPWSDWMFYDLLRQYLPADYHVHWANSTVVRYAQLFDFDSRIRHSANRGTSGIDGSHSTALGYARRSGVPVLHVTGDLSFLYDSSALWAPWPTNLKTIVLQNGGGDIFRFIPGPQDVPDYERYFVAPPRADLESMAAAFGLQTQKLRPASRIEAGRKLNEFLSGRDAKILLVDTSEAFNARILKDYFTSLGD